MVDFGCVVLSQIEHGKWQTSWKLLFKDERVFILLHLDENRLAVLPFCYDAKMVSTECEKRAAMHTQYFDRFEYCPGTLSALHVVMIASVNARMHLK